MLITLRIPKAAADKLNLVSATTDEELTVTLAAVELAGRLTFATGKPIAPEAVVRYCSAWQRAVDASSALADRHGPVDLTGMIREGCGKRSLWVPDRDDDILLWLQCVLLVHFLSSRPPDKHPPEEIPSFASLQTAAGLTDLCEMNFPGAYHLWTLGEATAPSVGTSGQKRAHQRLATS